MTSLRLSLTVFLISFVFAACSSGSSEEPSAEFLMVLQTAPQDGSDQAPTEARIGFQVDAEIDPATLTSQTFFVTDENGVQLEGERVILDDDPTAAEIVLDAPMEVITNYTATVTTGLQSLGGAALEEAYEWTFKTLDSEWGVSEWIEEDINGTSREQDASVDGQSNAIAVWVHETASGTAIWANRYSRTDLWGEPVAIDDGGGRVAAPKIAADEAGNGFAVWERINEGGATANIWANRYDVEAGAWDTAELLQTGDVTRASEPSIAAAPDGTAVATWAQVDLDSPGSRLVIWARVYAPGSGWGEAAQIGEPAQTSLVRASQVGMDAGGNAIAVWSRPAVGGDVIWSNRYTPGAGWGTPELIKNDEETTARPFELSVGAGGDAFVVWLQSAEGRNDVWAVRFSGSAWGTPERVDDYDDDTKTNPDIVVDGSGVAHAVWSQADPRFQNIWSNQYNPGSGWGAPELIEPPNVDPEEDANALEPSAGINAAGNAFVVWIQNTDSWTSIWSNRLDPETGWVGAELIEAIDRPAKAPLVIVDDRRHAHALWLHFVDSGFDWVRTNRFE